MDMGEEKSKDASFFVSGIAAKIRNIDGRPLGADGKPLVARRGVKFVEPVKDSSSAVVASNKGGATVSGNDGEERKESFSAAVVANDNGATLIGEEGNVSMDSKLKQPQEIQPKGTVDEKMNVESQSSAGKDGKVEPISYATVLTKDKPNRVVNFRLLQSEEKIADVDVAIPRSSVIEVQKRFENTLYGYFLGKRLAFPIVENYVKNAWAKFGISRVMMNSNGFFFFKFASKAGLDRVLEEGPWLIRAVPLILNIWSPSVSLKKEDIISVPVWVKLHDVPLAAFTEDGLSMIASQIGTPKMLDAYTSSMCLESWGRNSYARALIEINAAQELKEEIVVAVPDIEGKGYSKQKVHVEYEWKPPRCDTCKTFGHSREQCPKKVKEVRPKELKEDGFNVVSRKGKGKIVVTPNSRQIDGVRLPKPKPGFYYRPIQKKTTSDNQEASSSKPAASENPKVENVNFVEVRNSYEVLRNANAIMEPADEGVPRDKEDKQDSDDDEVEMIYDETAKFMESQDDTKSEGASTPVDGSLNV